jgi:hypothetical protein
MKRILIAMILFAGLTCFWRNTAEADDRRLFDMIACRGELYRIGLVTGTVWHLHKKHIDGKFYWRWVAIQESDCAYLSEPEEK